MAEDVNCPWCAAEQTRRAHAQPAYIDTDRRRITVEVTAFQACELTYRLQTSALKDWDGSTARPLHVLDVPAVIKAPRPEGSSP